MRESSKHVSIRIGLALTLICLAALIAIPLVLKPRGIYVQSAQDTLVILSPHNEAIRYEFTRAFTSYYQQHTGRTIRLDWRMIGGAEDIMRYVKSEFRASFARWCAIRGLPYTKERSAAFDNASLPPDRHQDNPEQAARRAFLESEVGIGIDLLFGGSAVDFAQQAQAGTLVDCDLLKEHPEWFRPDSIPKEISGSPCYDPQGRWIGTCLTSFGICFNMDSLERLGVRRLQPNWETLADPKFVGEIALANPIHSSSAAAAYEMIVQQQMQQAKAAGKDLETGWKNGLTLLQRMGANARYFADSAPLVPFDVSQGDAAFGVCIDFYGRFQSEAVKIASGRERMRYFTPAGGSAFTPDPIAILRGAPHSQAARLFVQFVLSLDGQKLWNFRLGTPGGPVANSLRRLPIRKELYAAKFSAFRSDPDVNPYQEVAGFQYHPEWTAPLLQPLAFIMQAMCVDSREELVAAWKALRKANFPPQATARFGDLSTVSYSQASGPIRQLFLVRNPLEKVRAGRILTEHFRQQYREATVLAQEGK